MTTTKFKTTPHDLIFGSGHGGGQYVLDHDRRLAVYLKLATEAKKRGASIDAFFNTSGIGHGAPDPFALSGFYELDREIAARFTNLVFGSPNCGITKTGIRELLASFGFDQLDKPRWWHIKTDPIRVFDFARYSGGRIAPQLNSCHQQADRLYGLELEPNVHAGRYRMHIRYGYPRDGSAWSYTIAEQEIGETIGCLFSKTSDWLIANVTPLSTRELRVERAYSLLDRKFDSRGWDWVEVTDVPLRAHERGRMYQRSDGATFLQDRILGAIAELMPDGNGEQYVSEADQRRIYDVLCQAINSGRRRAARKAKSNA